MICVEIHKPVAPTRFADDLAFGVPRLVVRISEEACADLELRLKVDAPAGSVLRRRVHTWFDALRTLRFIHGMREACLPSVPWRLALASASFLPESFRNTGSPDAVCQALATLEAELPAQVGPTLL